MNMSYRIDRLRSLNAHDSDRQEHLDTATMKSILRWLGQEYGGDETSDEQDEIAER